MESDVIHVIAQDTNTPGRPRHIGRLRIPKRLGEGRGNRISYSFRSLMDAGAIVLNHTDVPVEDVNPIMSFCGFVARKTNEGKVVALRAGGNGAALVTPRAEYAAVLGRSRSVAALLRSAPCGPR
ncbi:MAG TPA: hypothetical protein VFT29_17975 [Gemmatimonadaceae bacterium]|nr:hypothetical protein [Gemmatimonadaceae bacterium]